jgi:hypothetical protein
MLSGGRWPLGCCLEMTVGKDGEEMIVGLDGSCARGIARELLKGLAPCGEDYSNADEV